MDSRILATAVLVVTTMLGYASPGAAQSSAPTKVEGLFHDYTAELDASGPWQLVGAWSATLKGASGKVDVLASLSMVRSDAASRSAHTHHIGVIDGDVTALPNGYRVTGTAIITSNGAVAPFSGSAVVVEITGNAAVPLAKVTLTFQGAAVAHFGDQPIDGVVAVP